MPDLSLQVMNQKDFIAAVADWVSAQWIIHNDKLYIIKGTVDFKIINKENSKIIKTGSISSSINTGSVSSLYSVDENNNFAKERIAKYLASKLYRKILLNTYTSEN